MAKTTKSGKKKRLLTAKQINLQLKTWAKNYQPKFNEIIMQAEQRGVLNTKTNTISSKNKRLFNEFSEYYSRYYGSYSNFLQHEKAKYAEQRITETTDKTSFKSWFSEQRTYAEMIGTLYHSFESTLAREEDLYLQTLTRQEAIDRLKRELRNEEIEPTEVYENEYGTLQPNWS